MSTDVHTTSRTFHFPDTANRTTECHSFAKKKKTQQVCVSKLWAGKNYDHAQQKLRQHRKDILQVQICSGTQGYTQEFKQIFYSQKCMQVNKCSKEPLNDPKFSWIHYNRTETGLYWPIYCTVCVFIVDQTEDLLKYWHEVMTFVNTKDGFHLYISFYSYLCKRVFFCHGDNYKAMRSTKRTDRTLMAKNESSSCWLNALGVPGMCIASHQHGQNLVHG